MVFFTAHIHDTLEVNPFTINFLNFTASVEEYVQIKVEYIGVVGIGLAAAPAVLCLDSNRPVSGSTIGNLPNATSVVLRMVDEQNINTYWEASSKLLGDIEYIIKGSSDVTFTLRDGFSGAALVVPLDYQQIIIKFEMTGL